MIYTKELIKEIKELYPENLHMHELADMGSIWLGRHLCDSIPNGVDVDRVLNANSLEEIKKYAMICKRKRDVYTEWNKQTEKG